MPRMQKILTAAHKKVEFFDKYRENVAADVAGSMNNAYIENHNQPAGVKSYGMVVDLAVAYYKTHD